MDVPGLESRVQRVMARVKSPYGSNKYGDTPTSKTLRAQGTRFLSCDHSMRSSSETPPTEPLLTWTERRKSPEPDALDSDAVPVIQRYYTSTILYKP